MIKKTKARILHVDDNQDTRLLMAAVLGDAQYGVMTAGTVAEALQLAREIQFDLFILDIRLEDGSGIELCQQLKKLQPDVGVLYYSAYGSNREQESALAICGDAYLRKPVGISDLEEAVTALLAKRGILPETETEAKDSSQPAV
jgi:DNA-binding response OmpR family regulator